MPEIAELRIGPTSVEQPVFRDVEDKINQLVREVNDLDISAGISPSPSDDQFLATRDGALSWGVILASDVPELDAEKIASGQFTNGRISEASVRQYEAKFSLDAKQIVSGQFPIGRIPADLSIKGVLGKGVLPAAGTKGRIWWDTGADHVKRDTGGAWEPFPTSPHALVSPKHTASGLTIGYVVRASGATEFVWAALNFSDLAGQIADTQVPQSAVKQHEALLSIGHTQLTYSGLTIGHVWRADGATTAGFAALQASDIPTLDASKIGSGVFDSARIPTDLRGWGVVQIQALAPTGDTLGELWQDSDDDVLYVWDGAAWQAATATAAPHTHPHTDLTFSGLTAGHVWRASGATAASFAALQAGDLPSHTHAAGDVTSGTFGTGAFTFPGAVTMQSTLDVTGVTTLSANPTIDHPAASPSINFKRNGADRGRLEANVAGWRFLNTALVEKMRLTDAGHLALGTTDVEDWDSAYVAFQVGKQATLMSGRTSGDSFWLRNAYYDGSFKYLQSSTASLVTQDANGVLIRVAPSGTADTGISWTDALTIHDDNIESGVQFRPLTDGNVVLGGTTRRWSTIYGVDLDLSGKIHVKPSPASQFSINLENTLTDIGVNVLGQINVRGTDDSSGIGSIIVWRGAGTWVGSSNIRPTDIEFWTNDGAALQKRVTIKSDGVLETQAPTTARAGFRLLPGAAPTSPQDGDMWSESTLLKIRMNGITRTVQFT